MTLFLTVTLFYGIHVQAKPDINIGIIGPKGMIQWDGLWEAAQMARDEINAGGGILGHSVALVDIDSHGAPPEDPSAGIAETLDAIATYDLQFLVGGFRTEVVGPIREAVMDYAAANGKPIWFIAGASTDYLIDSGGLTTADVRGMYNRYKYMFRVTPMNSTLLFKQFAAFLKTYVLPERLANMYGSPVKTWLMVEDLSWADLMCYCLGGSSWFPYLDPPTNTIPNPYPSPPHPASVLGPNATVIGYDRPNYVTPPSDWGALLTNVEDQGARLIVHIFSGPFGADFISNWGSLEINALPVGINVPSQMQEFYDTVTGLCKYESFLASVGTKTPIVPGYTDTVWDDYKARWGHAPIYTAWGAYDAIMALNETITQAGTWPMTCDQMIPKIEQTDRQGILGQFKYTGPNPNLNSTNYPYYSENPTFKGTLHDVYCNIYSLTPYWPPPQYVRALIPQWQEIAGEGLMQIVWPQDQSYSRRFRIPPWMYNLSLWDLNFDGLVDISDVAQAARAFGTLPGDPRWDIESEVTGDGLVDISDIAAVARKFGQVAPVWPLP